MTHGSVPPEVRAELGIGETLVRLSVGIEDNPPGGGRPPPPNRNTPPLHLAGIESVILENRSRDYIESRIRAGLLEQWASRPPGRHRRRRAHAARGHVPQRGLFRLQRRCTTSISAIWSARA